MDEEYRRYTVEQAKRYMQHIRSLNHTVRMLESEIDELRDLAGGLSGIDYATPQVASSPSADAVPNAVIRIESLTAELEAELSDYIAEKERAHRALAEVDGFYAALLTYRYCEGRPWADVTELLSVERSKPYSQKYVEQELRDAALAALYPYIPHGWRDPVHPAI